MNLTQAIQHIYPDAQPETHFTTLETETGMKINAWRYDHPQPTDAQFANAWLEIEAALAEKAAAEAKIASLTE